MKQTLLIAGLAATLVSSASATLVAAWDFQTTTTGGTAAGVSPAAPKVYNANFGSGTLFLDGTNGSSLFFEPATGATNSEINGFGGTALNADTGIGMSTVTGGVGALAVLGGLTSGGTSAANGKAMTFLFNMTGLQNLAISFAVQRTSTGFTSEVWEYSTNGTTWGSVGTVTNIQSSFQLAGGVVTNLSVPTGLDNAATAYLRVTFAGATSSSGNNRIDNIQFNADPVPAPGALALLSLAGLVGSRRRRTSQA